MFCPYCGSPLLKDSSFCSNCGASLKNSDAAPKAAPATEAGAPFDPFASVQNQAETPASPSSPAEFPAPESEFATPDFEGAAETPKPEVRGFKKVLRSPFTWIGVGLAAVLTLVIFNFAFIKGSFIKTFGSDKEYLAYAEDQAVSEFEDSFSSFYRNLLKNAGEDFSVEYELAPEISRDALTLISDLVDLDEDLSWVNNVSLKGSLLKEGNVMAMDMGLSLKNKTVADLSYILDADAKRIYLGLPSLTDLFIYTESVNQQDVFVNSEDITRFLPEEKELTPLLRKYVNIVIAAIEEDEVSSREETLEVGDLTQKVTVLEFELDDDALASILKAVLKEMEKDEELKKIVSEVVLEYAKEMEDMGYIEDAEDYADEVMDEYEDGLDDLIDEVDDAADLFLGNTKILFETYVSSSHEVLGRRISNPKEDDVSFLFVTLAKGSRFATEINLADQFILEGEGTNKNDVIDGTYTLEISGEELGELTLENFKTKDMDEGIYSGTIIIKPSRDIMKELLGSGGGIFSSLDIGLQLDLDVKEDKQSISASITKSGVDFVKFTMNVKKSDKKITIPDEDDCLNMDNGTPTEFFQSIDLDEIIDALEEGGVSDTLLDALRSMLR